MNVLFLTLANITSKGERGIYQDLLRKFLDEGHSVYVLSPLERREGKKSYIINEGNLKILKVRTLNIQKANIIEKGFSTLSIDSLFLRFIRKELKSISFDLILYSTPPITLTKVIRSIKRDSNAFSYLLLKDIFPQNAIDLKMLKKGGLLHRYFRQKEKNLYNLSDKIGCMSPANIEYVLNNNDFVDPAKVEENPNTIQAVEFEISEVQKKSIRNKYAIPLDKKVLVYGGNLGKPQGLDFLINLLNDIRMEEVFFLIIGSGTEFPRLQAWINLNQPKQVKLIKSLAKDEYDVVLSSCDVGLIFLNPNFSIPNFPSRLLSYLEMKMPVIAATDEATDLGEIIEKNNCGLKVKSGDIESFWNSVKLLLESDLKVKGENGFKLLQKDYTVDRSYQLILKSWEESKK